MFAGGTVFEGDRVCGETVFVGKRIFAVTAM